tara:strand:- start:337 stop:549 length:213 start_codon:yes stop_codon:yes gene_type:complete
MTGQSNNPLGLEDKLYTIEEFALAVRTKFGANDSLPDSVLVDIFINKYPMYSCKVKKNQGQVNQSSCGCC